MTFERFPYQIEGAQFLAGRRRALLLDEAGLGKTVQAIDAAGLVGLEMDVVNPASVTTQWRKEYAKLTERHRRFTSRSYEAARDKGLPADIQALVLDELHYCTNPGSGRTVALLGYEPYGMDGGIGRAEYVWGMTATPAPRDPSCLFPAMRAIVPGSLWTPRGTMAYWDFMKKFCVMYKGRYGMTVKKGQNLEELKDRLAPYMLRRTKKQVLKDWKEPVCAELYLDAGIAADDLRRADFSAEGTAVAEAFQSGGWEALRLLAETDDTGVSRYRRYVGLLKITPVARWLLEQFESGLNKIVVVCIHREVIEGIHISLAKEKIKSTIYYGGMTDAQKEKAKKTFIEQPDCRAIIAQLIAFGTGTDGVQKATGDMLFAEWDWIGDNNYQTLSRLDRIGQENPVLGRFAGLDGSLDGAIMASASRRTADNRTLFNS